MTDQAFARATDPSTSHNAARSIEQSLPKLESAVFNAIRASGDGLTVDAIVELTGLDKVTVSPRLRPLCNKRLVVADGTRLGRSGRQQTVWKVSRQTP